MWHGPCVSSVASFPFTTAPCVEDLNVHGKQLWQWDSGLAQISVDRQGPLSQPLNVQAAAGDSAFFLRRALSAKRFLSAATLSALSDAMGTSHRQDRHGKEAGRGPLLPVVRSLG